MPEISAAEGVVVELDGFLNAIRCVIGVNPRLYGAHFIEKNGKDLEQIVQQVVCDIGEPGVTMNSEVDFKCIQRLFNKYIYLKLEAIGSSHLSNLDWNLVEYYGLISTAENENGPWNRLVGQKHKLLEYSDNEGNAGVIFFVEHENFVVMTCLAEPGSSS